MPHGISVLLASALGWLLHLGARLNQRVSALQINLVLLGHVAYRRIPLSIRLPPRGSLESRSRLTSTL